MAEAETGFLVDDLRGDLGTVPNPAPCRGFDLAAAYLVLVQGYARTYSETRHENQEAA